MSTDNQNPEPRVKSGLIILLVFLIGIPLLGILASMLGYSNN
jgi:hypothetical protein